MRAFAQVFATEFNATDGFGRLNFAGRTDGSLVREFFALHGIPATTENFQRFFDRYVFWLDHLMAASQSVVCAGVWDFIRGLKAVAPAPLLGLLTGNIRLGAEIKLRHVGLWDEFAMGGFADDHEERGEIARRARQRGCQMLGADLRDDQVLVIGDTPLDIRCARYIGAKVLAVATGGASLAELQAGQPDWAVNDLRELSPAAVLHSSE